MFGIKRLKVLIWSATISILTSCGGDSVVDEEQSGFLELYGSAQGTTYSIIVADRNIALSQYEIDSLLDRFDEVLSTYKENSIISQINRAKDSLSIEDPTNWFDDCYRISEKVYKESHGAFDPSIMPLVDAWGFYRKRSQVPDQAQIDSLLSLVSFENGKKHTYSNKNGLIKFIKTNKEYRLDFNAVAQGLSVDVVADYIRARGAKNYYVEIGGEIRVAGKNREGENWRIGIDSPQISDTVRLLDQIIAISDKGIATSGNYRKFYVEDGVKYSHTIDPRIGKPVQHTLLSATVITKSTGLADAWATAFMVIGKDEAIKLLNSGLDQELDVYFIYDDGNEGYAHWMSSGFEQYLTD